ncbi:RHS repeat-associated core domain-containing protein [Catenuloplanes sp. NPDC051500]|uniref:RHS repeat-associated core domain-containing protein n=1 Tax=Catenuloplanes sp. NPDC051500 TaxID=3363959 RepID=UPI003793ADA2
MLFGCYVMLRAGARRWLAGLLSVVMTVAGLTAVVQSPASAAVRDPGPGALPADAPVVHGSRVNPSAGRASDAASAAALTGAPAHTPVSPGRATLRPGAEPSRFGGLRLSVGEGAPLRAEVTGGSVIRLTPASSEVEDRADRVAASAAHSTEVSFDYRDLAASYGGGYGSRLRLMSGTTEIDAVNDTEAGTLTARVSSAGAVLALAAGDSSAAGDYSATTPTASSSWTVAGSSGALSWSYPMRVPPVPGGLEPQVELSYSSQAVDGRTAATNNQGSWIGEGFTYEPGYVERQYRACKDDGHDKSGDLCWARDNLTISLGGRSHELVRDSDDVWRLTDDDGTKVTRRTGATNGDNDGEYFEVTTPDGTIYSFGLNRLDGWSTGKDETNSVWSTPVFGDDSAEPCYKATFADAWCRQGWRWNLDYVRDPHDNVISYFYDRETNYYARSGKTDVEGTSYHRGGVLKRIDYGQRHKAVYTTNAPGRVVFGTTERCIEDDGFDCAPGNLKDSTAAHWPDVPWDRNCASGAKCKIEQNSPTFWTRKRLTTVTTQIRGATDWSPVDRWTLTQIFTDNGDGSRSLWLRDIDHRGLVGDTADLPNVRLLGAQLPNRVDKPGDNISALIRFRLTTVQTDAGAQLDVHYADADCAAGDLPKEGESTRRCFPVKWHPNASDEEPVVDWFHKYVVSELIETDLVAKGKDMVTRYEYLGDAGWAKAKADGISPNKYLTWSDWRGYQTVRERRGDGQAMPSRTDTVYYRGMGASIEDSTGGSHADPDGVNPTDLEKTVYDGSKVVTKSITDVWRHVTRTETGSWGSRTASIVRPASSRTLTALAAGGWRETKQSTTYDTTYGLATVVDDLGDISTDADDQCTRSYYTDAGSGPDKLLYRTEVVSVKCAATPDRRTQVVKDERTYYDKLALGAAPVEGEPSKVERLTSHNGTTGTYQMVNESTYDTYGRQLSLTNTLGKTSRTEYTDTYGLQTGQKEFNLLGQDSSTEFAPAWGLVTARIDVNKQRTDLTYDPLGRRTAVWLADRSKAAGISPSVKYTYLHRKDVGVTVKTENVETDGTYVESFDLYDGHLRLRQSQAPGPEAGRLVTDTYYNGLGLVMQANDAYYAAGAPDDRILGTDSGDILGNQMFLYDGAGRQTNEIFLVAGLERWRTVTSYGGDRVTVDPPQGAATRTSLLDAKGQAVEVIDGAHRTKYHYTPSGQLDAVTDPAGDTWTATYDQRGRKIESYDPDSGTTSYAYDDLDRVTLTTDSRTRKVFTTYDDAGRVTATYEGTSTAGTRLTQNTYDTAYKGQLYSSARFVNGKGYGVVYTNRDAFYRPERTRYVIPDDAGAELATTYEFSNSYNRDGTMSGLGMPAAGGLPAEGLAYTYDALERPTALEGVKTYVTGTDYGRTGSLLRVELNTGGKKAWISNTFETGTNRLTRQEVKRQDVGVLARDAHYSYDAAGNVLSIADTPIDGTRDVQCFTQDGARRLTEAWTSPSTAEDPCAGGPAATGVGGVAAYHHSYTYDASGNRASQTVDGVTRDYVYADAQPHTVRSVTSAGQTLATYSYDTTGNTRTRDLADGTKQTLNWTADGHLESVTDGGRTTSYVYTPDGERLLSKEPGATTLFLPGMELRLNTATKVVDGTRYYSFGGQVVAVRSVTGVTFLAADHQGTGLISIDATTGATTVRRTSPFGETRGTAPATWPTRRGFVGGFQDVSGLTHLGAREYDPSLGRFISDDPVTDYTELNQLNGYAYAGNSPVTLSDPTGMRPPPEDDPGRKSRLDSPHNLALIAIAAMILAFTLFRMHGLGGGKVTVDIGSSKNNTIPKARQDHKDRPLEKRGDGAADIIWWGKDVVYVWEVKPANGYGRKHGPEDLDNYIARLQEDLVKQGLPQKVMPGPWLPTVPTVPTGDGKTIRVWSEKRNPGVIFYAENPSKKPDPPKGRPVAEPKTQPQPVPKAQPEPQPRTVPQPVPPGGATQPNTPKGGWEPDIQVDEDAATVVGEVIVGGIAIIGCILLCIFNPALA